MDSHKQQVAERVKEANNILVTVSANPSVDQLAACIGLTVALNKMGKHATAVFSGEVPSTLEFLQPEKTIEKTTDSLRDFIIALDKSKADKLRYKVEDRVVKIFITPYRTSLTDKDLEFSQGDFNVDVIVALGVHNQSDLDQAITAHGRILHDAAIITLNNKPGGELGNLNWLDPTASSLSELSMQLLDLLDHTILDEQIATAMLTGIVAETNRFSNAKTTPQTMSISAELMTAGANQQLVASKLEEPVHAPSPTVTPDEKQGAEPTKPAKKSEDGTLEIAHDEQQKRTDDNQAVPADASPDQSTELTDQPAPPAPPQIHIDEHGSLSPIDEPKEEPEASAPAHDGLPEIKRHSEAPKMVLEPPTLGGQLTASGMPDSYELLPSDPLTLPSVDTESDHIDTPSVAPTIMPPVDADEPSKSTTPLSMPDPSPEPAVASQPLQNESPTDKPLPDKTLTEIERDVHSSHLNAYDAPMQQVSEQSAPVFGLDAPIAPPSFDAPGQAATPIDMPVSAPDAVSSGDHVQSARDAVAEAINGAASNQPLPPIEALNAQPLDAPRGGNADAAPAPVMPEPPMQQPVMPSFGAAPAPAWNAPMPGQPAMPQYAPDLMSNTQSPPAGFPSGPQMPDDAQPQAPDPNAPPQVPPPFMPPQFR